MIVQILIFEVGLEFV